jgi:hypothetical protein
MASRALKGRRTAAQDDPLRPREDIMHCCRSTSCAHPLSLDHWLVSSLYDPKYMFALLTSQSVCIPRHGSDQYGQYTLMAMT